MNAMCLRNDDLDVDSMRTGSGGSQSIRRLRRHQRTKVNVRAIVRSGSCFQPTLIRDISSSGIGLAGAYGLFMGSDVEVSLLNGERRAGVVRWWLAGNCGIEFHEPLKDEDRFLAATMGRALRNSRAAIHSSDEASGDGSRPQR